MGKIMKGLTTFLAVSTTASALGSYEKLPGYVSANQVAKSGPVTRTLAGYFFGGACTGAGAVCIFHGWFKKEEENSPKDTLGDRLREIITEVYSPNEENDVMDLHINDNDQNVILEESSSKVRLPNAERIMLGAAGGLLTAAGVVICFLA